MPALEQRGGWSLASPRRKARRDPVATREVRLGKATCPAPHGRHAVLDCTRRRLPLRYPRAVNLQLVSSRSVAAVGYDAETSALVIRFHNQSRVYRYMGVPREVYDTFMSSSSMGRFFTQHIKGNYPFERFG
jgi:hypothetical protein